MYKLIKHRGYHDEYIKENTFEGILKSLNDDKYIGVEFDVRMTKDNKMIIYHNPIYNGKLISNTNYFDLPSYIPLLEEILNINSDKIFLIEIKNINNNYEDFIKLIQKHKDKKIYVMSFSNKIIKKIDVKERNYKIGILNYILNTDNYYQKLDFVCILNSLVNKNIINIFNKLQIFSYGLFEKKTFEEIIYIVDN